MSLRQKKNDNELYILYIQMLTRNSKSAIGMFYPLHYSTNLSDVVSKVICIET